MITGYVILAVLAGICLMAAFAYNCVVMWEQLVFCSKGRAMVNVTILTLAAVFVGILIGMSVTITFH